MTTTNAFLKHMSKTSKFLVLGGTVILLLALLGAFFMYYNVDIDSECTTGACGAEPDVPDEPVEPEPESRCIDTDNGLDYAKQGTCIDDFENRNGIEDSCDDSGLLTEYYCDDLNCVSQEYSCTENESCSDGECVDWKYACTDSDLDDDTYKRGVVTYFPGGVRTLSGDKCLSTGFLRQYSCDSSKTTGITFADTPCKPVEKCVWGVCTTNETVGDGGNGDGGDDGNGDGGDDDIPANCGNMQLDQGEQCDDGNNRGGDGCSADCRTYEVEVLDANSNCPGGQTGVHIILKTQQNTCQGILTAHPKVYGVPIDANYVCCVPTCEVYYANDQLVDPECANLVFDNDLGPICPSGYMQSILTGGNGYELLCHSGGGNKGCCNPDPCAQLGGYCGDMPADFACDARGPGYFASDEHFCLDGVSCCLPNPQ